MNVENKQRIIDNLFDNKSNLDKFKEFITNILKLNKIILKEGEK